MGPPVPSDRDAQTEIRPANELFYNQDHFTLRFNSVLNSPEDAVQVVRVIRKVIVGKGGLVCDLQDSYTEKSIRWVGSQIARTDENSLDLTSSQIGSVGDRDHSAL